MLSLSLLSFIIYCTVLVKTLQYLLLCNGNTTTFLHPFCGIALMVCAFKLLFAVYYCSMFYYSQQVKKAHNGIYKTKTTRKQKVWDLCRAIFVVDVPRHAHNTHTWIMGLSLVLHHIFADILCSHIVSTLIVYTLLILLSLSVTSYL